MTITTRPAKAALAATIALLAVAGCGGGDDDTADRASSTEQTSDADTTDSTNEDSVPADDTDEPKDDDDDASAAGGDPCRLLTSAEAEAILGSPVGEGQVLEMELENGENMYDCAYHVPGGLARSVHVGVLGASYPKDEWERGQRAEGDVEQVSGVGELAFFNADDYKLEVFDDGRWLQAQIIDSPRFAELKEMLIEVVRNALDRI